MESNHLPCPTDVAPEPHDAAVAGFQEPSDTGGPRPLPRRCRDPQRTRSQSGRGARPAPISLAFPAGPVRVEVGPILAAALESRWKSYRKQLRLCQKSFSEEAVHELRVATRRLLAPLTLLRTAAPSAALDKARRSLKRRPAVLGELRDTQVQRRFIEQKAARFPELLTMLAWLERRERRFAKAAAGEVRRFKTRKLERWISVMIESLTADARRPRVQNRMAAAVRRATGRAFAEAVERRRAIDLADLRTIHRTRVAFKRFRYMLESLSPGLTGLSKRQLRALACYQRRMGIIQDLEVMQACVARYIREDKKREARLQRFNRHLRQCRGRALRSFRKSADRLYEFWPPAELAAPSDPAQTRDAA
jgi:CHAD domain-containing protein